MAARGTEDGGFPCPFPFPFPFPFPPAAAAEDVMEAADCSSAAAPSLLRAM